jgi:hypothetical protein
MTSRKLLAGLGLFFCVSGAAIAQTVTVDFTGVVTSAQDAGSLAYGSTVTGAYTFDYGAAQPFLSYGTVGDPFGFWAAGDQYSAPPLGASVFTQTLSGGGYSFSSAGSSVLDSASSVVASPAFLFVPGTFSGTFYADTDAQNGFTTYTFSIFDPTSAPYTSAGLPVLSSDAQSFAGLEVYNGNSGSDAIVNYQLTSLTLVSAVPEPSTYAAMLIGLGMLGFIFVRRSRSQTPLALA